MLGPFATASRHTPPVLHCHSPGVATVACCHCRTPSKLVVQLRKCCNFSYFQDGHRRHVGFFEIAKFYWLFGWQGLRRISVPNFVKIGQLVAKILWFFDFSRWRPSAILDLFEAYMDHQQWAFGGLYHSAKFGYAVVFISRLPIDVHDDDGQRRRQQQRQRVTEGTAMAPWNGPNDDILIRFRMSMCRMKNDRQIVAESRHNFQFLRL